MGFWENKRVLVTGASGFVGTNLLKRMEQLPVLPRVVVHERSLQVAETKAEVIKADLTKMDDCRRAVADIDIVFHCAASTSGAAVISRTPLVHLTPNVVMNAQLLEAAYFAGVKKFVWLSSSTGYPLTGDRPVKEEEMMNGDPYDKYFCVGWMKRYAEILCRTYAEKLNPSMPTVVLRPTNIYGDYDDFHFETSHVFAALIRRVVERHDPIEVWGNGEEVRDLIYIDDLVNSLLIATEKVQQYAALNIGLGKGYSVKELLALMLKAEGYENARIQFDPTKPTMIPVRLVDITKAEREIGFSPQVHIMEGIRRTLDWYKAHRL